MTARRSSVGETVSATDGGCRQDNGSGGGMRGRAVESAEKAAESGENCIGSHDSGSKVVSSFVGR